MEDLNKNNKLLEKKKIEMIMSNCEIYRKKLIEYCQKHFDNDYESACDCVQDAYVALYENLLNGIEIRNYKAWLYQVTTNCKNKALRIKIKRNEIDFIDNEEKDKALENSSIYFPDFVENMVTDEIIEERAIKIIGLLTKEEKYIYIQHYWKNKTFAEIGYELGIKESTVGKKHKKLKNKILQMIKEFEKIE